MMTIPGRVLGGWGVVGEAVAGVQMVDASAHDADADADADAILTLGAQDVDDMLALARLTRPGPFERGTRLMGRYLGVRRDGALVAMAGERLHPPGWVEISAVCTHPSARGQGLGGELVRALVAGTRADGFRALLHVEASSPARALYERLGFVVRRPVALHRLRPPPPPDSTDDTDGTDGTDAAEAEPAPDEGAPGRG